jgi:hypothetical protein
MRFGLFGSAQAKRGGPDVDSGAGFREFVENNEGRGARLRQPRSWSSIFTGFARSPRP